MQQKAPPPPALVARQRNAAMIPGGGGVPGRRIDLPSLANCTFIEYTFTTGLNLPAMSNRVYFIVVNTSLTALLYFSITGVYRAPFTVGLPIAANLGFYEPAIAPTNPISISGAGYAAQGLIKE